MLSFISDSNRQRYFVYRVPHSIFVIPKISKTLWAQTISYIMKWKPQTKWRKERKCWQLCACVWLKETCGVWVCVCVGMRGCEECLQCVTSVHMKSENVECRNGRAHWPHKRRKTLRAMEPPPSFLEYYHDRLCVWVWAVVCVPVCIVFV